MPLIAFTSPKGGVGKTTIAAHMAAILRTRGHSVLAIDLDPQNVLRLHLGLSMRDDVGFMSSLGQRSLPWRSSMVETPSGVDLLPYGSVDPRRAMELNSRLFAEPELLAAPLRDILELPGLMVILDTPPGPSPALEALMPLIDLICLVLLADAGSAALLPVVAGGRTFGRGTLAGRTADRVGVIMNQVDFGQALGEAVMECAINALGSRLLGAVCRDEALAEALASKHLLTTPHDGAADDLQVLADTLAGRVRMSGPGGGLAGFPALTEWGLR
jgi:cellulose synthase operon protein YhjQ